MSVGTQRAAKLVRMVVTIEASMRNGINYYRIAVSNDDPQALGVLKRAVRLPYRIEDRIQHAIDIYGLSVIDGYLSEINGPTISQLRAILQPYKDYSDQLASDYTNTIKTESQIATDIELNCEQIDTEEFPISPGYTDVM